MSHCTDEQYSVGVRRITITNPGRANALTPEMASDMRDSIESFGHDPSTRVILIRGSGDRHWCGGFDLGRLNEALESGQSNLESLMVAVRSSVVPVVAVVNGAAIGAGLELLCMCDLRVVARGILVGVPAARLGIAYRPGGIAAMIAAAPATRRLLLTGESEPIEGVVGLADYLVEPGKLDDAAAVVANALVNTHPDALVHALTFLRALKFEGRLPKEAAGASARLMTRTEST